MPMKGIVIALVLLGGLAAASAAPSAISVYESRQSSAMTEGDATIATDPDTAFATATDYAHWSRIFPGVRRAVVTQRKGNDARVTFLHSDGTTDHLHFIAVPRAHKVWFEQTGGKAEVRAEIVFAPGKRHGTTHVHSRLFAQVPGLAGAFVSSSDVRALRQQQVHDDLVQLQAYFASVASK
jgi:hypothetical protein